MKNKSEKKITTKQIKDRGETKQRVFVVFLITHDALGVDSVWSNQADAVKRAWQLMPDYSDFENWEIIRHEDMLLFNGEDGDDIHIGEYELEGEESKNGAS